MDKSVKRIRPTDFELSQVQDNLAECIQQLLDSANGAAALQAVLSPVLQQLRGAGTPYSVKTPALQIKGRSDGNAVNGQPTVVIGEPTSTSKDGVVTPQKDASLASFGPVVFVGSAGSADQFIVSPKVVGVAFRIPNIANTDNLFTVFTDGGQIIQGNVFVYGNVTTTGNTTVTGNSTVQGINTANSMVSAQGFKNTICCGTWWNNNYAANAPVQLQLTVMNAAAFGGAGSTPFVMKFTHSGSIVGATLNQAGTNTGTNSLLIYKNGVLSYTWVAGAGANNATFWQQFPKGSAGLSFAAGDTLTTFYRCTTGGNSQILSHLTIEMVA